MVDDGQGNIIFHSIFNRILLEAGLVLNEAIICICSVVLNPLFADVFTAIKATESYKYYQR
jgi:hypothetical protein